MGPPDPTFRVAVGPLFAQLGPRETDHGGDLRLQAWTTGPPWSLLDNCLSQDPAGKGHLQFRQDCLHPWESAPVCAPHRGQQERLVTGGKAYPLPPTRPRCDPKFGETPFKKAGHA